MIDRGARRRSRLPYLLLLLPFVGTVWPSFYARAQPTLGGWPFFYWYLLLWVPLSAIITGIVYLTTD